ncbi:ribonuclease H-like domain-containing protein [Tanacetum coccineum]
MSGSQDEIPPPPPPPPSSPQTPTQQTPHTVSTIKLPILKKGEYDIWAMKMEHYLAHTDYPIWEVIQNGNGPVSITTDTQGQIKVLPPRTAEEIIARERERKARTTLLMALPEDHLAKFHKMTDAKEMWDAIKSRFGGNDESKKMQKYILKQQFEGFSVSNTEGLHKGYDRFQSLLSQLEIHGAGVDSLSFDDLYNNLRVFESDVKGSTASSSGPQNVAFVSENTSSTNEVSTAYCVSNSSGQNPQYEQTSSYSLLANQSSCPQLDHEDLEQLDEYDLEEMDLKWQVAMISMRMKKFYKKTGRKLQFDAKEPVGFDKTKVECYNCHKTGHFARECRIKGNQDNRRRDAWNSGTKDGSRTGKKEDSKALVTIDGEGVDWTNHSEEDEDYALMACNSSESDTEVTSCSNKCKESYANLKKLYDAQREQLSDASIEIKAYSQGLKKVEAQLVAHQQGQLWYEQKIKFMKIDLDDKTDVLTYHKKLLAEAQKEKEDLKAKVEKWHNSSKNLSKLLNTQMSANDKFGLGYGDHRYDGILSYENEVLQSVFMNKESELEKQPLYDRFVTAGGMHVVPPPMTGNYMPSGPDIEVDYSQFTYGPKQTQPMYEPVVNESNVECQPKVWSDAPMIEEYESDRKDEYVYIPTKEQETPSFANQQVKTPRETVKNQFTHSQKPKVDKKELGYGFTVRACFVCGSLNHLIRDCDFHEKRMARKAELNNGFSWVFFLRTKDETSGILKDFIRQIENQLNQKVKTIRCDNGTKFKNKDVIEFCGSKGIKKEYSNARTPQQNGVAERKNRTLIEAARTMLADSFLPNTFWAEAVSTACYVLNRVLVTKPHNKTPYELLTVGYSLQSKAFRVYNLETKRVEENLHITFLENKPNVAGKGPTWLFDLDYLTDSMNYHPVRSENQANIHAGQQEANHHAGTEDIIDAGDSEKEDESAQDCFVLPIWPSYSSTITPDLKTDEKREDPREEEQVFMDELERLKRQEKEANEEAEALRKQFEQETENLVIQAGAAKTSSTNIFSTVSTPAKASSTNLVNTVSIPVSTASPNEGLYLSDPTNPEQDDSEIPPLEDIYQNSSDGIFTTSSYDDEGAVADFTNLETVVNVSPIPTSRIISSHPSALILGDPTSAVQTRSKVYKSSGAHAFVSYFEIHESVGISRFALWEEGYRYKVGLWNKKDERGVVVRNKARLVTQGHRQEEWIDYDENGYRRVGIVVAVIPVMSFDFANVKTASTPIETQKPLVKDEEANDVDVHLYRSDTLTILRKIRNKKLA